MADSQNSSSDDVFEQAQQEYHTLLNNMKSVMLGSVSPGGTPDASYAPAFMDETRHLYVYISGLAKHTGNIIRSKKASAMIIEDESVSEQLFARKRVTYLCDCTVLPRDSEVWKEKMALLEDKFGDIISSLKQMTDFELIKMIPKEGRLVLGFGRAFRVTGVRMDELGYFGGSGHRTESK